MLLPVSNIKLIRSLVNAQEKDYLEEQVSFWEKQIIYQEIDEQNTPFKSKRMI